jgi:hypothetical protein
MSGTVTSNTLRSSGVIAATAAGLNWVSTPVTASTVTVESGNGYWINTTSNAITITLPSSAEKGDQIIFIDYLRTWGTNAITIDSNGLNYQGEDDSYTVEYTTSGQSLNIVYSDATKGWIPLDDDVSAFEPVVPITQKAIFGYGITSGDNSVSMSNLVSSSGVVASDVTGVGTARHSLAAATYGGDRALFGYGGNDDGKVSITNLVNNLGVIADDTTGVGTARSILAAATYGEDKAIFGYGTSSGFESLTNLVSNSGVVSADVTGVGTARQQIAASEYGVGKAIFGYGYAGGSGSNNLSMTNLVSDSGVVAADVSGVGSARRELAAAKYGGDKGIFGYGNTGSRTNVSNKISNLGVVASDTSGVGTARRSPSAASYGEDKAIFGYGHSGSKVSITNLVNNVGTVAADVTGVGTEREGLAAAGFSAST